MALQRKKYDCCFNPFKLEKHGKKSTKNLRRVLPTMLRKLNMDNTSVPADMRICDNCRLRISKIPETSETSASSSHTEEPHPSTSAAVRSSSCEEGLMPIEGSVSIPNLTESLVASRTPRIDKRKLPQSEYLESKLQKLQEPQTSEGLDIEEEMGMRDVTVESDIIENLKEAFRATNDRSKRIQILTLFNGWSSTKIHENFDVSDHMIAVAKKCAEEQGILSTPNMKTGKKLDEATLKHVVDFYTSDYMSHAMAGQRNYVSVMENGQKIQQKKRLIFNNLKETYHIFKDKYPDLKVGFSKFCESRPTHCVLSGASGTHSVGVCTIHENVKLMLDGARIAELTASTSQPVNNYEDCLLRMMCNPPSIDCRLKQCANCPETVNLMEQLEELFESELRDTVTYKQWISEDRTNLETLQSSVDEFLEKLQEQLGALITHEFIAQQQSAFFLERKEQLKQGECLVVCHFAENYSFMNQDAVQGVYWNNGQVTLHPFVVYYNEDETIKQKNYIAISECLEHDAVAVHLFQRNFVNFLKREIREVSKIIYFTDGAREQYKNKFNFSNICHHEEDFGVGAELNFFINSHGMGACVGIAGDVKRLAAKSSLEPIQEPINTPQNFFAWAQNNKNIENISLEFFTNDDYDKEAAELEDRYEKTKSVPDILEFHSIQPISKTELIAKRYSKAQMSVTAFVCK